MIKYILLPLLGVCFLLGSSNGYAQKARTSKGSRAKAAAGKSETSAKGVKEEIPTAVEEIAASAEQPLEPAAVQPTADAAAEQPVQPETAQKQAADPAQAQAQQTGDSQAATEQAATQTAEGTSAENLATEDPAEGFVVQREEVSEAKTLALEPRVVFNPKSQRDPTLSPDDLLLLAHREKQRLAAIEAERQRKLAEERRKREEAERQRLLELERLKDPTKDIRNRIHVSGVIGQEVFIGDKIYTVGNSIYGARIIEVTPDYVVFSYKGHQFRRNVKL